MLETLHIPEEYDGFIFLAEAVRNPPILQPHRHVELEVNLVVDGEVTYVIDRKRYVFKKGSLLWFFPEQKHQLIDRSKDAAYYVAVFTPMMISECCKGERYAELKKDNLSYCDTLYTQLAPAEFTRLRSSMDRLATEGIDADELNRESGFGQSKHFRFSHPDPDWLNAGLRNILLASWRFQQGHETGKANPTMHHIVRRAIEQLNQQDDNSDLSTLAKSIGVSTSYLSRLFLEETGLTMTRFRNNQRLRRFWENYQGQRKTTLLGAALDAGFGSYAQFYRVYREAYGEGPRRTGM